jgi:multidrug efflux pump subunit AcrB
MNITGTAIKYNRVTYVALIIIIALGLLSYKTLPRDSMPPFTVRVASVVTSFPGAGPERVEALITDKIEKVAQEIPEVDYISSESRTGLSVVSVSLKENVPKSALQPIWDRLRRKIDNIKDQLPAGIYGPNLKDDDVGVVYGISVGLVNDGFESHEVEDYADDLRDKLIKLDDAAKVELGGVIDQRIFIDFDDAKLAELGLSGNQLKGIISSTNIIIPAGEINLENERVILEPSGNFESIDEIRQIMIPTGKGKGSVFLGDITNVYEGYITPRKSIVKINGMEGISLYISLKEGANIINLGVAVNNLIAEYNKTLPVGINVVRMASQDYEVQNSINDFISNLLQSIIIVVIVMFLFLGMRTGIVVASLIPTAIILTLLLMNVFTIGLNQVSLAALIMALGMLVDNAIVMSESMMVKMERGATGIEAAISSSKELMIPLLTSSLTTSAAFLSFFLAESVMGEIMGSLFEVITIALLSSWLMALTVVPMLAVAIIRVKKKEAKKRGMFDLMNFYYKKFLIWTLNRPVKVVLTIVVLLIISLYGFTKIPVSFMPDSERNLVTLDLNLPLGTAIESTESSIEFIERFITDSLLVGDNRTRGVTDWSAFIGEGPNSYDLGYFPGEANSGYAHLLINTSSGADNQFVIDALDRFCFMNLPDAQTTIKRLGSGGGSAIPVEIRISGDDPDELLRLASKIKTKLIEIPGTKSIDDNWGPRIKKFLVNIDPAKLSMSGLTNQDIAVSSSTTLSGFTVGEYRLDDKSIPIVMRTEGSEMVSFDELEGLSIFSQSSATNIPLAQVASIVTDWQYAKILRRDIVRNITVQSQLKEGVTANDIFTQLGGWLKEDSKNWKPGYSYEFGGDAESSKDAMGAVADKLPLSLFIIILLLIMQFNSVRKSAIIMSTIPLGLIGIVGGLLITGSFFSFTAFLGIISLAGIIINNAIVLIDRIQIERVEKGRSPFDSIVYAAFERFRPILLTTFTTSFGLIPLWIGGGAMWRPMAIAIIFGLLFATVITLIFVPIVYKLLYKVKR